MKGFILQALAASLVFSLLGCNVKNDPEKDTLTLEINAVQVSSTVKLEEEFSKQIINISATGRYAFKLPSGQKVYNLNIIESSDEICQLSPSLTLSCYPVACTTDHNPVCAKQPLAGVQCVTTPCETDAYKTFSNQCFAATAYAAISFSGSCQALEGVTALPISPVIITELASANIIAEPFNIVSQTINQDTLNVSFEFSGGCGSHEFELYLNNVLSDTSPPEVSNTYSHASNDNCIETVKLQKQFDLLPLKEIYRQANPEASGEQQIILEDIGTYIFTL
ncbi:hypothetical protein [Aliikangiella sp. IMCC44632]